MCCSVNNGLNAGSGDLLMKTTHVKVFLFGESSLSKTELKQFHRDRLAGFIKKRLRAYAKANL